MTAPVAPVVLASCVEHSLHQSHPGFDQPAARLYGVTVVDPQADERTVDGALRLTFLAEDADVSELLESPAGAAVRAFDAAVVLTSGWAAPVDDGAPEMPPSRHPGRRRVRLVVVVCDGGVGSVLRFADAPDDVVADSGSAHGSLADAVTALWSPASG
jgi:hypothetical protein